ncbi:UNVERIFIED_CONTAM: hypothetical protein GTU68_066485 [Idotea baltica]|nr:hypothetical protein [Idotea baltica]
MQKEHKIAIIGLGYVGLPVALALAKKYPGTIGFDINEKRVAALASGVDENNDVEAGSLEGISMEYTSDPEKLRGANFFVVAVPTPIDEDKRPDLSPLESASKLVGKVIAKDAVVVFESTVYPGVTEEVCGPIIAKESGLQQSVDFKLGYSPERINPGDREHTLERIVKVVSGEDAASLEIISDVYGSIIDAGIHKAESIKVAEAAKVIENTQRDLNIALMNELALIFDRMGISTIAVLEAAGTKWNFLPFRPGLVGGHCIGVDPYYLTTKAEKLGYQPHVITAGRRVNDGMGAFVASKAIKLLSIAGVKLKGARVGVLGLTFKEDISDLRNSRIPDIIAELKEYGVEVLAHDPYADAEDTLKEYGVTLASLEEVKELDALVYAVSHSQYKEMGDANIVGRLKSGGILLDVKSALVADTLPEHIVYWAL